ncbi:hypothetical protein DRO26_02525 [Candidatus Bathyarchaeota archaeon]|nr:MAG: hypothetical protein DRO26_02525 [Candidatus Bathyarchaeota archaeon]
MNSKTIERLIHEIRNQLNFSVEVTPNVLKVYQNKKKNLMVVVVADRPDKSATFGPGGLVSKNLTKKLGLDGFTVKAQTYIFVKKFRVKLAIKRLRKIASTTKNKEIKKIIKEKLVPLLKDELKYPERELLEDESFESSNRNLAVVAFSGGVDSWVTTLLAKKVGLNPIAVSVSPGKWVLPEKTRRLIKSLTSTYNIPHKFLEGDVEGFRNIFKDGLDGKSHPCGKCAKLIEKTVVTYAKRMGVPLVLFGDLLPTGNYSAHFVEGILRFNVLAALNLTKSETIVLAKKFSHPGTDYVYGCPMLREIHRKHSHLTYPSIQRVLREVRAELLEPTQALKYLKNILSFQLKHRKG